MANWTLTIRHCEPGSGEHARSVEQVDNLTINEFSYRVLGIVPVWIVFAEQALIKLYKSVWNSCLDGFGKYHHATHCPPLPVNAGFCWSALYFRVSVPETIPMMVAVSLEFAAFPAVFPETSLVVALTTMVSPTKLVESSAPDPTVTTMPPATGLVLAFSVTVFRTMKRFA